MSEARTITSHTTFGRFRCTRDGRGSATLAIALWLGLSGCPIYDDSCGGNSDCASGYRCDDQIARCVPVDGLGPSCTTPSDCGAAETCTPDFRCLPGSCDVHGCVPGYVCAIDEEGVYACLADRDAASDAGAGDAGDAAAGDAGARDATDAATAPSPEPPDGGPPRDAGPTAVDASSDGSAPASDSGAPPDASADGG